MLHVIREYALEQLEASGEADSLSRAHAAYFVALAQHAEPELTGAHQRIWLERLASDYENLRAALTHLASTAESADQGLKLAGALAIFWYVRGLYGEGLHWLQRMLDAHKDETTSPPVAAVWGAGLLQLLAGDAGRASALLEHSLALARDLDDRAWMSRTLDVLGLLAFFGNDLMLARQRLEESVELARQANDRWSLADALGTLGSIYPLQGAFDLAEQVEVEALAIARSRDDLQGMRMAQFGLALTAARRGDLVAAQHLGEDGLAVSRAIGDRWFAAYFLWILANAATASGDIARGRVMADESLSFAREVQGPLLIVCALEASAAVAHAEGDDASAESQLVEAEMIGRDGPVPGSYLATALRAHGELLLARDDLMRARQLFDESFAIARQVGDAWSTARALSSLALVAWRQNDVERAQVLIGEAIDIATQIGDRLGLAESRDRAAAMSTRVAKGAE